MDVNIKKLKGKFIILKGYSNKSKNIKIGKTNCKARNLSFQGKTSALNITNKMFPNVYF